jgi:hypothetical protein
MMKVCRAADIRDPLLTVQGLYAKLVEAFKKMGLEVVPGKGAAFDPNVRTPAPRASWASRARQALPGSDTAAEAAWVWLVQSCQPCYTA